MDSNAPKVFLEPPDAESAIMSHQHVEKTDDSGLAGGQDATAPGGRAVASVESLVDTIVRLVTSQTPSGATFYETPNLTVPASGSASGVHADGEAANGLRATVQNLVSGCDVVQLSFLFAQVGADQDVLAQLPGITVEAAAAARSLGAKIATAAPASLAGLVEAACLKGWGGIAHGLSQADLESGDPAVLPFSARQALAEAVDSIAQANPGFLDECWRTEVANAFCEDRLVDSAEDNDTQADIALDKVGDRPVSALSASELPSILPLGTAEAAEEDQDDNVILAEGTPVVTDPEEAVGAAPTEPEQGPGSSDDEFKDYDWRAEWEEEDRSREAYKMYEDKHNRRKRRGTGTVVFG